MKPFIIAQGAEALLIKQGNTVRKQRVKKGYRLPILDEKLRKQRTRREIKSLEKARVLIPVPKVITSSPYEITLEYIKGKKLSESLDTLKNALQICVQIGKNLAKIHDANIIHGDLTTSNMILSPENKLYFIDFGLSFESSRPEDKAVDLHLIKEALEAKHFKKAEPFFNAIVKGYDTSKNASLILQRLKAVEKRGRYKESY